MIRNRFVESSTLILTLFCITASASASDGKLGPKDFSISRFPFSASGINECNAESVPGEGILTVAYAEKRTPKGKTYEIRSKYNAIGHGSLGNDYVVLAFAKKGFNAPTQDFGSYQSFDLSYRTRLISLGDAPNTFFTTNVTILVANKQVIAVQITGVDNSICKGSKEADTAFNLSEASYSARRRFRQ